MVKKEFVSPEGFRLDGRRVTETRAINMTIGGISRDADGSAFFEIGNTKVLAVVFGPWEGKRKRKDSNNTGKGAINCKYVLAPFSTMDRKKRSGADRQAVSFGLAMRQTFQALVVTEAFPKSQVDIYCHVLEADGGELCAAINAATLALMDAGVPMRDIPAACSASVIGDNVVTDPSSEETPGASASLTLVVQASTEDVILTELDAKLPADMFAPLWENATTGAVAIAQRIKEEVRGHIEKTLLWNPGMLQASAGGQI